jgi:phenylalanyl-tRNA synthetase alpha chain
LTDDTKDPRRIMDELSLSEKKLLLALSDERSLRAEKALRKGGFSKEVELMNAASWLRTKGLLEIEEEVRVLVNLGHRSYAANGLPERIVLSLLDKAGGAASLGELESSGKVTKAEIGISIGHLNRKRWARIKKEGEETYLVMSELGKKALDAKGADEELIERLAKGEVEAASIDPALLKELKGRKDVVTEREIVDRRMSLTHLGRQVAALGIELKREVTTLTPDLIRSGKFAEVDFRRYDVNTFAVTETGGRIHPLTRIIERVRRIFLEMGFTEIAGNFAELELWNMDALFIPQDHPAREMQDTFYVTTPSPIGPMEFNERKGMDPLETFKRVHEDGGGTGSTGWGYSWSEEKALMPILRTHTTVNTIRYLYDHPEPPIKVFSIEKVFRNESLDAHHLPEFYQIEGILTEEGASFDMLVGILKEFYSRMGFSTIRLRPGFFPYTEPSMEVDVLFDGKWMELGGSGIFRPEVTIPSGVKEPVLAWGLGLERLAMLVLDLKDIRELYVSDVDWLRSAPFK